MARKNQDAGFGGRLKQLRESRSLDVSDLAKRINVSRAAIWHWENRGTRPRNGTIGAIADALSVPRGFLESGTRSGSAVPDAKHTSNADIAARAATNLSLEELIRAIEAKGFDVHIRSRA